MSYDQAISAGIKFFIVFMVYSAFLLFNLVSTGVLSNLDNPRTMAQGNVTLPMNNQTLAERIAPVGKTKMAGEAASKEMAKEASPVVAKAKSGEEVYNSACFACHGTGILNSPKKGDVATWEPRLAMGMDALVASAIKGKGAMPARGGNAALSDSEIKAAIEFMAK